MDALPGGRQNRNTHCWRVDFTRCTSGGKAKLNAAAYFKSQILPDALPGGRQNSGAAKLGTARFYPMHFRGKAKQLFIARIGVMHFTRCTSGGRQNSDVSAFRICRILPDALPGEGKTRQQLEARHWHFTRCTSGGKAKHSRRRSAFLFYPMHFRGEGKTCGSASLMAS